MNGYVLNICSIAKTLGYLIKNTHAKDNKRGKKAAPVCGCLASKSQPFFAVLLLIKYQIKSHSLILKGAVTHIF